MQIVVSWAGAETISSLQCCMVYSEDKKVEIGFWGLAGVPGMLPVWGGGRKSKSLFKRIAMGSLFRFASICCFEAPKSNSRGIGRNHVGCFTGLVGGAGNLDTELLADVLGCFLIGLVKGL
jgi:hypothetical protein